MSDQDFGACCISTQHSCEICGLSGLSDELMRDHTRACHVEGNVQCPFCGYSGVVSAELLLHVNQAHLDYLTPENELSSFIDYQNQRFDVDHLPEKQFHVDSEIFDKTVNIQFQKNNYISAETSLAYPSTNEHLQFSHNNCKDSICNKNVNQEPHTCSNKFKHSNLEINTEKLLKSNDIDISGVNSFDSASNISTVKDNIEIKSLVNGLNGKPQLVFQESSSRSHLDLKLKSHSLSFDKISFLQCPLCSFTSQMSSVLEEHINRSHFDPLSPINGSSASNKQSVENGASLVCPICSRMFLYAPDLELHVNIEHRDILSPGKSKLDLISITKSESTCPICNMFLTDVSSEIEMHIEEHFSKNSKDLKVDLNIEIKARKLREKREFEMLRAQYGMDEQGNFREQSAAAMQRAVYAGEMSVADYYERQVGLRAAESHGIDDSTSCTKSVAPRVMSLSSSSAGVLKSYICTSVDHYASNYGDKGWGCGYRNLQMLLSSLLQNTSFNETLYSAWGNQGPSRTAMPSISRLQKMVEAAWTQGFDVQGSEQLGCKLYNTRKWIGATEIVTVLSWLRINCQLIDFHRPTALDGRHPELFNWVLTYFEEPRIHTAPLYLQHQGHSRTIIGIEKRSSGLTLLVLDPSHGPRQVAALGAFQDTLRLIRRGPAAMRAPQYQIVAVKGLIKTEEQYQASKILRSLRIPPDR